MTANNCTFHFPSLIKLLHGILSLHQSEIILWITLRSGQNFNNKSFPNSNFSFSLSAVYIWLTAFILTQVCYQSFVFCFQYSAHVQTLNIETMWGQESYLDSYFIEQFFYHNSKFVPASSMVLPVKYLQVYLICLLLAFVLTVSSFQCCSEPNLGNNNIIWQYKYC